MNMKPGVLSHYKDYLPVTGDTPELTLGEGNTPLVKSKRLAKKYKCGGLYFKLEGCHPTGSFKDRGMVVAVAKAIEDGSKAVICASTGNTSASAAAYAAHSGLECVIVIPKGNIALGKLAQAVVHGAKIVAIDGNFDAALKIVRSLADKHPVTLVNSLNPYRIEGQKTAAFEIVDVLGRAPDYLFLPVGNAGNITAYWKGFKEYYEAGKASSKPKMYGFQAAGAAPIVLGRSRRRWPRPYASATRPAGTRRWPPATSPAAS
jgi:threonine synthase